MSTTDPIASGPSPLTVALAAFVIGACTTAHSERLAEDVDRYLGAMQTWAQAEVEADQVIKRILTTQFVDDAEVLRQIAESRPRVQRHLHVLRAYRASTPDVQAVHRQYLHAWQVLLTGYSEVEHGIKEAEPATLARGREGLLTWRRSLRNVAEDLGDLARMAHPAP